MRRANIHITVIITALCWLLPGCNVNYYQQQKQEDWHNRVNRGLSAVLCIARPGMPLLVSEQLIALIGCEPDLKVSPLEFVGLIGEDDPFQNRTVDHIWKGYCRAKQRLGELDCVEGPDRWRDCEAFKEGTLWVYDESLHFSKPLHSGEFFHCLFCARPYFSTAFFYVEEGQVIGATSFAHDGALQALANAAENERTE